MCCFFVHICHQLGVRKLLIYTEFIAFLCHFCRQFIRDSSPSWRIFFSVSHLFLYTIFIFSHIPFFNVALQNGSSLVNPKYGFHQLTSIWRRMNFTLYGTIELSGTDYLRCVNVTFASSHQPTYVCQ